ncbi:hypothetical protein ACIQUG_27255 [Ensifer sp. NPDC090286]|uniref:hypothetical protein n=1 Tax=Ensifer sp. NPDC090286 TaxID=3363991 RepID=UPI00383ACAA0
MIHALGVVGAFAGGSRRPVEGIAVGAAAGNLPVFNRHALLAAIDDNLVDTLQLCVRIRLLTFDPAEGDRATTGAYDNREAGPAVVVDRLQQLAAALACEVFPSDDQALACSGQHRHADHILKPCGRGFRAEERANRNGCRKQTGSKAEYRAHDGSPKEPMYLQL